MNEFEQWWIAENKQDEPPTKYSHDEYINRGVNNEYKAFLAGAARVAELEAQLEAIGAGGVESLRAKERRTPVITLVHDDACTRAFMISNSTKRVVDELKKNFWRDHAR